MCSSDLFEIGHLWRIAGFHQRFEATTDELNETAAQDDLFAEKIGLAFFAESRFDDARTSAANGARIGQADVMCIARRVLVNGNEAGNATALLVLRAHRMPRTLRCHHEDVEIGATRVRANFKPTRLTALAPRRIPVRIAIDAPAHIAVHREEVYAQIRTSSGQRAPAPFSRWLREANAAQTDREALRAVREAPAWRRSATSRQTNAEFVFT